MLKVIINLEVIRLAAKQLHYNVKGESFYSDHLLMDTIQHDIEGFVDDLKENIYMRDNKQVPYERFIYEKVINILPDQITIDNLREFIITAMRVIDNVLRNDSKACDSDLLGKISSNLAKSLGFLNNRLS